MHSALLRFSTASSCDCASTVLQDYEHYIHELKKHYPNIWVSADGGGRWPGNACFSCHGASSSYAPFCCLPQVRPTQFGVVDSHTLFVAFEGRATDRTPMFKVRRYRTSTAAVHPDATCKGQSAQRAPTSFAPAAPPDMVLQGVDLFYFNDDATKIREIEGEGRLPSASKGEQLARQKLLFGPRRSCPAVYRSNWLGAEGHEDRKRQAQQHQRGGSQPRMTT